MQKYHDRIEALKRSRERAASAPASERASAPASAPAAVGPPASGRKGKASGEAPPERRAEGVDAGFLLDLIVDRYSEACYEARAEHRYKLPNGALRRIADAARKDLGAESLRLPPNWMDQARKRERRQRTDVRDLGQEQALLDRILAGYVAARAGLAHGARAEHLPPGGLDRILEGLASAARRDLGMEAVGLPANWKVALKRRHWRATGAWGEGPRPPDAARVAFLDMFEDVYRRYADAKAAHGGILPPGTCDALFEDVRRERNLGGAKPANLGVRCATRFRGEHPDFGTKYDI